MDDNQYEQSVNQYKRLGGNSLEPSFIASSGVTIKTNCYIASH